jgi:hypothetical protein
VIERRGPGPRSRAGAAVPAALPRRFRYQIGDGTAQTQKQVIASRLIGPEARAGELPRSTFGYGYYPGRHGNILTAFTAVLRAAPIPPKSLSGRRRTAASAGNQLDLPVVTTAVQP